MSPLPPEGEPEGKGKEAVTLPRPGHADLAGVLKYGLDDVRDALERASARHTAVIVAAGAVAKALLREIGIEVSGSRRRRTTSRSASTRHAPSATRSAASSRCAPAASSRASARTRRGRPGWTRGSRRR